MSSADRPPDDVPVVRRYVPPPRPPFPGFGWALLCCLGFLAVTQAPGALVAALPLVVKHLRQEPKPAEPEPGQPPGSETAERPAAPAAGDLLADPDLSRGLAWGLAVSNGLGILAGWTLLRATAGRDWRRAVALRPPAWVHVGLVVLVWPAFSVLGNGLAELVKPHLPSLTDLIAGGSERKLLDQVNQMIGSWPWWVGVLVVGLAPGVSEELFCRGFLGRGLVGRYGPVTGVLLTSLCFGLLHVEPVQ